MSDNETGTATAVLDRDTETEIDNGPGIDPAEKVNPPADLPEIEARWMRTEDLLPRIAENVRTDFRIEDYPDQVASIKENGVLDPINATREWHGGVYAEDGQVRILIAHELGIEWLKVFITAAPVGLTDNERRAARTLDQINYNKSIPLTKAEYAAGVALTIDLGTPVSKVAKRLNSTPAEVKAQAKIGASPTAKALLETDQFSFDQLAVIGHYEALGDTEAVARLNRCTRSKFAHEVQLILAEREAERAYLEAALPYGAYGFGILTAEPDTSSPEAEFVPAELLLTADGEPVTAELVNSDPTRWVVYLHREGDGQLVEKNTGAIVEPEAVDWDTQDNTEAAPAPGLLHADLVEHRDRWVPFCYLPADQLPDSGFQVLAVTASPADPSDDDNVDEQTRAEANAEAARQAAVAREQARQDRARVEQLNVRGVAAEERRDGVLINFLSRRTPHTACSTYVAESMANRLGDNDLRKTLHLLGVGGTRDALIKAIRAATPARAWVIVTAMIVARHENSLDKSLWRNHTADTERYLHFLAEAAAGLDYALSDVEQAAAGDIDYRDIDIAA